MKTVTIYTDGTKTALRFCAGNVGSARPCGATAEHDKQAPSDRAAAKRNKDILTENL